MRKLLFCLMLMPMLAHAATQGAPLKVLAIGNSFTHQMYWALPPVADALGRPVDICTMVIGGCSLERHCQCLNAKDTTPYLVNRPLGKKDGKEKFRSNIPQMLRADDWDVVVIQQVSHLSWKPETYHPFGDELVKAIREGAPRAKIVMQETWSYVSFSPRLKQWQITPREMYDRLHAAYREFAQAHGFEVIPTGTAVEHYREAIEQRARGGAARWRDPVGVSPKGDSIHMNADGNYLQALVWAGALLGVDVTRCGYAPKDIDPERAAVMRTCAARAVAGRNATTVDPAEFGLSPTAEPGVNVAAMRRALAGGKKTVKVARQGVYRVDDTIFLDDDTTLECAEGVVFQRAKNYPNMFVNRGAYEGKENRNITIRNLGISVNGHEGAPGLETKCFGLRGNVAFFHVRNVKVCGFSCRDMQAGCYAIHFADFDGVTLDGFEIFGKKDGVHLNGGKNFVVRNGVLRTGDDGIALNASDWPTSAPWIGTIENGVVENVVDLEGGACNFVRVLTGAVPEWHEGIVLRRGEPVRVGKRVYFVRGPVSKKEYVSKTKPQHAHGEWTSPEGVTFLFCQDNGCRTMDIRNVTFRNLTMGARRGFLCYMDDNEWARSLHPEVPKEDMPHTQFAVENVLATTDCPIIYGCGNMDVTLRNVIRAKAAPIVSMRTYNARPVVQRVRASALTYPADGEDFVFDGAGIAAEVVCEPADATRKPKVKAAHGAKAEERD